MTPREESIVRVLLETKEEWLTRRQIGRLLGLTKSPYLIELLDSLVERGVIERVLGSWGGFSCWFFRTTHERVQSVMMFPVDEFLERKEVRRGEDE